MPLRMSVAGLPVRRNGTTLAAARVKGDRSGNSEAVMKQIALAKARAIVVRALAAVAVLAIYAGLLGVVPALAASADEDAVAKNVEAFRAAQVAHDAKARA